MACNGAGVAAGGFIFWMYMKTAMKTRMAATPPTTPPTIAAVLFELFEDETFGSQSVERALEVLPSGQSAHVEAPAAAYLPAWQSEHVEAPAAEYLPASQGLQAPRPR